MGYEIDLAREIITTKDIIKTNYIPIRSSDNEFLKYKDQYIEVVAAKNTKALHITIHKPLTSGGANPIVYVNDDGKCYRNHGERRYFIMYAERLLRKELTIGKHEHNILTQQKIDALFEKKENSTRIAHIHAYGSSRDVFQYFIDYLIISDESEKHYIVEDHEDGIEPRGNSLSKELDYEAAEDGYASLNMPCWLNCSPYEVNGVIYVLETEIEKGKQLLQQAFLDNIDKHIQKYEMLKMQIQNQN